MPLLPSSQLDDDCDDCVPEYMRHGIGAGSKIAVAVSSFPFALTFLIITFLSIQRVYPRLAGHQAKERFEELPTVNSGIHSARSQKKLSARNAAAIVFAACIGLSAVLIELILCEITNTLDPAVRSFALQSTLPLLLALLLLITPALEIYNIISAAGWDFSNPRRAVSRFAWLLEFTGLGAWLSAFWWLGQGPIGVHLHEPGKGETHSFSEACLERIGVIGVSLTAALAGFAAVSSLWQSFGVKQYHISDALISRKTAGYDSANEMLLAKRSRLRAVQTKLSEKALSPAQGGFMGRMTGVFRGDVDKTELRSLEMEVHGLETMVSTLSESLQDLKLKKDVQDRSKTIVGRIINAASYVFAVYCAYRIITTSISLAKRYFLAGSLGESTDTDPVTNFLAILAEYWDPALDQAAWSRMITFLLSALMLLAPFNAVLQTVLLFSRFTPRILRGATRTNLALLVGQIAATYVISATILLRSNVPQEIGGVINQALGAPLDPRFVQRWFEGWFMASVTLTVLGIFISQRIARGADDDYDDAEVGRGGKIN